MLARIQQIITIGLLLAAVAWAAYFLNGLPLTQDQPVAVAIDLDNLECQ